MVKRISEIIKLTKLFVVVEMDLALNHKKEEQLLLAVRWEITNRYLKLEDLNDEEKLLDFASRAMKFTHPGSFPAIEN